MAKMTITEALADIKTIDKRIEKQGEMVKNYLVRQEAIRDPLEKEGGSMAAVQRALQSIYDLEERKVAIRSAIARVNAETTITIGLRTRTIADWIVWRREVAKGRKARLDGIVSAVIQYRSQALKQGFTVVSPGQVAANLSDIIVNVNESEMNAERESMEVVLGTLDGQLSLKNATVLVTLPD